MVRRVRSVQEGQVVYGPQGQVVHGPQGEVAPGRTVDMTFLIIDNIVFENIDTPEFGNLVSSQNSKMKPKHSPFKNVVPLTHE